MEAEICRANARQLIMLANASDSEAERDAYYELAEAWLEAMNRPRGAHPPAAPLLKAPAARRLQGAPVSG